MMHGREKSDPAIVAVKPANKAANPAVEQSAAEPATAEPVEPRAGTKGNADQPGAEPGKRVTSAGSHTESRKGKEEGEAHRAFPSHQYRPARRGILRTQGECRAGCRSADVEGLRGRPRTQARGPT